MTQVGFKLATPLTTFSDHDRHAFEDHSWQYAQCKPDYFQSYRYQRNQNSNEVAMKYTLLPKLQLQDFQRNRVVFQSDRVDQYFATSGCLSGLLIVKLK